MTEDEIRQLEEAVRELATPQMIAEWVCYMEKLPPEAQKEQHELIDQAYQEIIDYLKNQESK